MITPVSKNGTLAKFWSKGWTKRFLNEWRFKVTSIIFQNFLSYQFAQFMSGHAVKKRNNSD